MRESFAGRVAFGLAVALVVTIVSVVAPTMLSIGDVVVRPTVALAIAVGSVFGVIGAISVGIGFFVGGLLAGGAVVGEAVVASAFVGVGALVAGLLATRYGAWTGFHSDANWGRFAVEFGAVAIGTSLVHASILGWGFELVGFAPFLVSSYVFVGNLAGALVLGLPATIGLAVAARAVERGHQDRSFRGPDEGLSDRRRERIPRAVALVALGWFVGGNVLSLGVEIGETVPRSAFVSRGLEPVLPLRRAFLDAHPGSTAVILFGALMFTALTLALLRSGGPLDQWSSRDSSSRPGTRSSNSTDPPSEPDSHSSGPNE